MSKYALIGHVSIKTGRNGKPLNKDIWQYFQNFVPAHFDNVELMLFNNETLPNLANMIDRLNTFDGIIVAGREPLKYLDLDHADPDEDVIDPDADSDEDDESPEEAPIVNKSNDDDDDDGDISVVPDNDDITDKKSRIDELRYHGIVNNNPKLKFSKINVIYSLIYYISKDLINVFRFDVMNRTGTNNLVPPIMKPVDPHYHHISELDSILSSKWTIDEEHGFDFESRGFPFEPRFRLLGFSLSNENYQAYFYFSRDDEKYNYEVSKYADTLHRIFSKHQDKFWAYNNKFENNAALDVLDKRYFFQDARVFTQILKTRGTLKFSANLFLGVPLWNEGINEFMTHYKSFKKWVDEYKKVNWTKTYELAKIDIQSSTIQKMLDDSKSKSLIALIDHELISVSDRLELKIIEDEKAGDKLVVSHVDRSSDLLSDPIRFITEFTDNISSSKPDSFFRFFSNYTDRLEGKFKISSLIKYYLDNMNEWQSCGIGDMGYYCILDAYYTYMLKVMIYDTNYQKVKDGYKYYITQTNFASLLESSKVHVDRDRFLDWSEWAYKNRLMHAREVARSPLVIKNYVLSMYNRRTAAKMKTLIESVIKSFNGNKRVILDEIGFINRYHNSPDSIKELYFTGLNKRAENLKLVKDAIDEGKKLTKTAKDKLLMTGMSADQKHVIKFLDHLNKKYKIGFVDTVTDKNQIVECLIEFIKLIYDRAESSLDISYENVESDYLKMVDDPNTTYHDIDKVLEFSTTKSSSRLRMVKSVLPDDHVITVLQFMFVNRLKSTTIDHSEFSKMDSQQFSSWISNAITEYHNSKRRTRTQELLMSELNLAKRGLEKITSGKKLGKHALRAIKQAYDFKYGERNTLEEYPDFIQLNYHLQMLKRHLKSISSVVEGSLGGGSFIKSDKGYVPRGPKATRESIMNMSEDEQLFYKTTYWNNDKDTLRWSSAIHCLHGDTLVNTTDGQVKISELDSNSIITTIKNNHNYLVESSTDHQKLIPINSKITKVIKSGEVNELIELTFDDGSVVKCTPNHRFMTHTGVYIEAEFINKHTKIKRIING